MLAGHETTAKAVGPYLKPCSTEPSQTLQLTFGLWELAKHRDFQDKLRAEINETLAKINARGDTDFTADDFESMPYLVAFTKVCWNHLFLPLNRGQIHWIFV